MGKIKIKSERKIIKERGKWLEYTYYTGTEIKKFNSRLLSIGDVNEDSRQFDVIAAVFDLTGFTNFCRQPDPYLILPKYLSSFLTWLFESVVDEMTRKKFRTGKLLHTELPFFAKFTGDGVIFLWSTENMHTAQIDNVIVLLSRICSRYKTEFFRIASKEMSYVPGNLRCGVTRGSVCSVGGGKDYVGPCINIASRIQKLSKLTFCFTLKGIDFFGDTAPKSRKGIFIVKAVEIEGIGKDERVCIKKTEYERLPQKEKRLFRDV